ncbi:cysteine desulfurase family protein [Angustibacter speluncae]
MTYLDHAATTPPHPRAVQVLTEELAAGGNPSSLHTSGRRARRVVEESRERIAAAIGAAPNEVVLTAGGTEADNLAVKGLYWARRAQDPRRRRVLLSAVEHHAVVDPAVWLHEHEDAELVWIPVDGQGLLDTEVLRAEVERDPGSVALVSVMWANNEVGTIQTVDDVVAACAPHGVPVHTDAVQAVGHLPVDVAASGVDALTLSGHKLGGPVGAGALVVRAGLEVTPVLHGGGQERGIRSGTLDTPAVAALSVAVEEAVADLAAEAERVSTLRDRLVAGVLEAVPDAVLRGAPLGAGRLPGNAYLTFPGCQGDSLLYLLDARGIECSTGSACQAGVPQPSHVLLAMDVPDDHVRGGLRFSLGRTSTDVDVKTLVEEIGPVVERARSAGLAGRAR